ncbi:MAG: hypothetical protein AAFX10_09955 [Pseudomonadota bacterium]
MLLSPTLRKIVTAALLLPAGVMANSSYADCGADKASSAVLEHAEWRIVHEAKHEQQRSEHDIERHAPDGETHNRLSRRDFYGRQASVAIIEL